MLQIGKELISSLKFSGRKRVERIILKAKWFKYPNKVERKNILADYPKITSFRFRYESAFISILSNHSNPENAVRKENLTWWNNCLKNRLGRLQETYIYLKTAEKRGFKEDYTENKKHNIVNRFQFDYHSEMFYYYFFSTRDIIAQIIRVFYNLDIDENKIYFNDQFISKIKESTLKDVLNEFYQLTKSANDYRNSLTHRFPENIEDNRVNINTIENVKRINFGSSKYLSCDAISQNMTYILGSLNELMLELKKTIKVD